jgi:hypothetical protein
VDSAVDCYWKTARALAVHGYFVGGDGVGGVFWELLSAFGGEEFPGYGGWGLFEFCKLPHPNLELLNMILM